MFPLQEVGALKLRLEQMTSLVRIEAERAARLESELLEELYQAEEHDLLISACSVQMEGSHQHIL